MKQEAKLCDDVETISAFMYLGDRLSASGGCEAALTTRTRCGWVIFWECGELLYGRRFPLRLRRSVYESYVIILSDFLLVWYPSCILCYTSVP